MSAALRQSARETTAPAADGGDVADLKLLERCMNLYVAGSYQELDAVAERRLTSSSGSPSDSSAALAALWSVVALARRARGNDAGAERALEEAVRAVPRSGAGACPPRVAALAITFARRFAVLSERAAGEPEGARLEQRIAAARVAAFWLNWRLAAAPGDPACSAVLAAAREALAQAHAESVAAMVARRELAAARQVVGRAVEAGELPAARADALHEMVAVALRREIDRLTAEAVRGAHDEAAAVSGLGEAEALLASVPADSLPPAHRAAATSRIWRGHAKLGFRRLRLGQLDEAADTLCRALAMPDIARRRQRQVGVALVRTLEGLPDQRARAIDAMAAAGNRAAALAEIAALDRRIASARAHGVSEEELEVAADKVRRLRQRLESAAVSS